MRKYLIMTLVMLASCVEIPHGGTSSGVVVLDIGHFEEQSGAHTPRARGMQGFSEYEFWCRYASEVKRVVTKAGYSCVITNRGCAPTREPTASYARQAHVVQLNHPDKGITRYPSRYFPDRVASGMVSADYAVQQQASCVVFLHHNSGNRWRWKQGAEASIVLCNKYNGRELAQSLCDVLNARILNHGMDNGGRECVVVERSVDADRAAGWLNTCDDAGIPAAVLEAAFLTNRDHVAFLMQDENARRYAAAIGEAIVDFLSKHGDVPRHYRADPNVPDQGSFGYAAESRVLKVPGAKLLYPTPAPSPALPTRKRRRRAR